jgi:hypothetical protein
LKMTDNASDLIKAGWMIGALILAGVAINAISASRALACVEIMPCAVSQSGPVRGHINGHHVRGHITMRIERRGSTVIGGRPAGCPRRFCGCALSLKFFGRIIPKLNLAVNWRTFPRVAPAPGMVAVRRGHVFKLEQHVGGNHWRVWDANSGGGKIRRHVRSIAGYTIHNPGRG